MAKIKILDNATTSQNSITFRINEAGGASYHPDYPQLEIYGTLGNGASFDLKFQASDGFFYSTGDTITAPSLYVLPYASGTVLRLDFTAGTGSNMSASVYNGNFA